MKSGNAKKRHTLKECIAIIPARGGSKSIPQKNLIDFCDKPLIAWTIEDAIKSKFIRDVYVSTDDRKIGDIARQYGAKVIWRPKKLATDSSSSEEALLHAILKIEKNKQIDAVVFLQATSPLREDGDIDRAVEKFFSQNADSLFSAAVLKDFCAWKVINGDLKSITYDYKNRGIRQNRAPYYLENGSIYIFKPEILKKGNNRLGGKIAIYEMPYWKSFEIDEMEDIELCEYFMKRILEKRKVCIPLNDIQLIVYDFDGVLTDNSVVVNTDGVESVRVNRSDGLAIKIFKEMGIKQIILTTEINPVVEARARKLSIPLLKGTEDKKKALTRFCDKSKILLKKVLYIGNDINDLEVMNSVGWPICPADASQEIRRISKLVLLKSGGRGVVRELLDNVIEKRRKDGRN